MPIKVKTQKSYYVTEFNVELPVNLSELNEELKAMLSTGKTTVVHNDGNILGVNVEQREKVPAGPIDEKIRGLLGLANVEK